MEFKPSIKFIIDGKVDESKIVKPFNPRFEFENSLTSIELKELRISEYPLNESEIEHVIQNKAFFAFVGSILHIELPEFDSSQILMLPKALYEKRFSVNSTMLTDYQKGLIFVNANNVRGDDTKKAFGKKLAHELTHLLSTSVFELKAGTKNIVTRRGITVFPPNKARELYGEYELFFGLHEAIAERVALTYEGFVYDNRGIFTTSNEDRSRYARVESLSKRTNINIDLIDYANEDGTWLTSSMEYSAFYEVLNYITLCAEDESSFDASDIDFMFFEAQFSSRLLPIATMIDGVFGKGAFRLVASMNNTNSARLVLKDLKRRYENTRD